MARSDDTVRDVEKLKDMLECYATGGGGDDDLYKSLRKNLQSNRLLRKHLPTFLLDCRNLGDFWSFIKNGFAHYAERREFLRQAFAPVFAELEGCNDFPSDDINAEALAHFDTDSVHAIWMKALERRSDDPEGAITAARTLLETVCKHILDESAIEYAGDWDLPQLYKATAKALNLAPNQHTEQVFKQILGGCAAVVDGLGALRNRLSDAHGQGKLPAKPSARHAQLAVNLAGSVATFLVLTLETSGKPNSN